MFIEVADNIKKKKSTKIFCKKKKQIQLVKLFLTNLKFSMEMGERGEWKVL